MEENPYKSPAAPFQTRIAVGFGETVGVICESEAPCTQYQLRFPLRTFLVVCPCIALCCGSIAWLARSCVYGIDNTYAAQGAVSMLIFYMETNDGRWPTDWECLRPAFALNNGHVGGWTFDEYRSRIWIDFNVNASELRQHAQSSDGIRFSLIGTVHIDGLHFPSEPNELLLDYFRSFRPDRTGGRSRNPGNQTRKNSFGDECSPDS